MFNTSFVVMYVFILADQITVLWSMGKLKLRSIGKIVQRARKMSEFLLGDVALTSQEALIFVVSATL